MNVFCGWWLLALSVMGITGTSTAAPKFYLGTEASEMLALPPDTHCSLSVSSPVVDYGVMSRWQLQDVAGGKVSPGTRTLALSVICPNTRTIKLLVEGEKNERSKLRYGAQGSVHLRLLDAQLDGSPVDLRTLTPAGAITENGGQAVEPMIGQQLTPVVQNRLVKGKIFTAQLEVQPVLSEDEARVSSRQRSEATLTLTLVN